MMKIINEGQMRLSFEVPGRKEIIHSDAVKEVGGKGEYMTPVELLLSAVISCTLTNIIYGAGKKGISMDGAWAEADKEIAEAGGVGVIRATFHLPKTVPVEEREFLQTVPVEHCTVGRTIRKETKKEFTFVYDV